MTSRRILLITVFAFVAQGVASAQNTVDARLATYRAQIDGIDKQIVDLLNKRADVVRQIGIVKKEAELPVAAPAREKQVLDRVVEAGKKGPLPAGSFRRIYAVILEEMKAWESSGDAAK
jgi:chorismate mutase